MVLGINNSRVFFLNMILPCFTYTFSSANLKTKGHHLWVHVTLPLADCLAQSRFSPAQWIWPVKMSDSLWFHQSWLGNPIKRGFNGKVIHFYSGASLQLFHHLLHQIGAFCGRHNSMPPKIRAFWRFLTFNIRWSDDPPEIGWSLPPMVLWFMAISCRHGMVQ